MDTEAGGQFWWTMRQVDSFGGQRSRWIVLVDTEVASFRPGTSASPVSFTPPVLHIYPSITEIIKCQLLTALLNEAFLPFRSYSSSGCLVIAHKPEAKGNALIVAMPFLKVSQKSYP